MERTTFGLLFYIRRDKTNKKGEAPVFMRLTINGERADASIKRFIEPHAWNSEKGKPQPSDEPKPRHWTSLKIPLSQDLAQNRPVEAREHVRRFH